MNASLDPHPEAWPSLPLGTWRDTYAALHFMDADRRQDSPFTESLGKPLMAHHLICDSHRTDDFGDTVRQQKLPDRLQFSRASALAALSDGRSAALALEPQSVASFYGRLMEEMQKLDLDVRIYRRPNEIAESMPFDQDVRPRPSDADYAGRFWRILQQADRVFKIFRARFVGKCSPVHFFWGAADLAVTRFSGRKAPQHPGGVPNLPDWVTQEAYSHEVSSCGF
jgi:hypothetical protein